jgi:hypothetical protein
MALSSSRSFVAYHVHLPVRRNRFFCLAGG